jgi:hypothetical protein
LLLTAQFGRVPFTVGVTVGCCVVDGVLHPEIANPSTRPNQVRFVMFVLATGGERHPTKADARRASKKSNNYHSLEK